LTLPHLLKQLDFKRIMMYQQQHGYHQHKRRLSSPSPTLLSEYASQSPDRFFMQPIPYNNEQNTMYGDGYSQRYNHGTHTDYEPSGSVSPHTMAHLEHSKKKLKTKIEPDVQRHVTVETPRFIRMKSEPHNEPTDQHDDHRPPTNTGWSEAVRHTERPLDFIHTTGTTTTTTTTSSQNDNSALSGIGNTTGPYSILNPHGIDLSLAMKLAPMIPDIEVTYTKNVILGIEGYMNHTALDGLSDKRLPSDEDIRIARVINRLNYKVCHCCMAKSPGQGPGKANKHNTNEPRTSLVQCGQCNIVYYCGTECQSKDWEQHREWCANPKAKTLDHNKNFLPTIVKFHKRQPQYICLVM